jgi:cytosine/adenosine deaminase-related metal-dependent hydrolase
MMVRGGVTTAMDHHYVFPKDSGDLLGAEIRAAAEIGVRFSPTRGSMDRGKSDGGLPPDFAVETTEAALIATEEAIDTHHDASFDSMLRIGVAPCSPFSVTTDLMRETAALARRKGVRLHTHGSETVEEEKFCHELFGMGPTDYFESTGWLGDDVWMAHCVHMNDADIAAFARTRTGVAHCPSSNARLAAGIARVPDMLTGGEAALTVRQALRLGTYGGAEVLGRQSEIGSIEAGKLADLALWKVDGLGHASIADPVAAIVLGAAAPLSLLLINGRAVVEESHLTTVDEDAIARSTRAEAQRLAKIAGLTD